MLPRIAAGVGALCLLSLLSGCPDPNTYGTPRTLAPGDVQMQVSTSGWVGAASGTTLFSPGLPTLGFRTGVSDRVDWGARVSDLSSLAADVKYNFLRSRRFDMALDPTIQAYYVDLGGTAKPFGALHLHLPLLLGFNFDEATTLVLTPGFVATLATADAASDGASTFEVAALSPGLGARLGLGLNVRTSDHFSWQPELTVWHDFNDVDAWVYVLGIGMNVGAQPDYSDLGDDASTR